RQDGADLDDEHDGVGPLDVGPEHGERLPQGRPEQVGGEQPLAPAEAAGQLGLVGPRAGGVGRGGGNRGHGRASLMFPPWSLSGARGWARFSPLAPVFGGEGLGVRGNPGEGSPLTPGPSPPSSGARGDLTPRTGSVPGAPPPGPALPLAGTTAPPPAGW